MHFYRSAKHLSDFSYGMHILRADIETVSLALLSGCADTGNRICDMGEGARLRAGRVYLVWFALEEILFESLDDCAVRAPRALARTIDIIEVDNGIRERIPTAIVRNEVYIRRICPCVGRKVATVRAVGRMCRR